MTSTNLLLGLLGLLFGALVATGVSRMWRRGRRRRRFRRGREGELEAEALLEKRGFRILDEQVRRRDYMLVDGERLDFEVRADLLVSRRRRTYVVEVKTGKSAPSPKNSATRRQLREYASVYEADGLILADMQAGQLREIHFPGPDRGPKWTQMAAIFVLGAMAGVVLATVVGG